MCGTAPAAPSDATSRLDDDDDDDAKTTTATASAIEATQSAIATAFTRVAIDVDDDDDGDASTSSDVERDRGGMSKAWCSPTAPVDDGIAARIDARHGCSRVNDF